MSIFGSIMNKIFHHQPKAAAGGAQTSQAPRPQAAPQPAPTAAAPASPAVPAPAPAQPVDVEAVLTEMAEHNPEKLNWRTSIVDLMKLLDLDSSLTARKELAHELGYFGDTADSAAMNIWLHKQVMQKLAENGGKVPADLKD